MKIMEYTFWASGPSFSPSEFERQAAITFDHKHEIGDPILLRPAINYDHGYGTFAAEHISMSDFLAERDPLLGFVRKHHALLRRCGAEECVLSVTFGYVEQCNLALVSHEMGELFALGVDLWISCQRVDGG